tara:strand:- start:1507 stop:1929 length:423 start_codon:yes stop_codon:yes gene_type:complete
VASKENSKMNKEILKIALNTKNLSFLENHTHSTKLKNSTCGDEIKIYLILKNGKITNFKYEGESCLYCQASASLLSRNIKNKSINKIEFLLRESGNLFENKKITSNNEWKKFLKIMNKSNALRKECLLLPIKATLKALKN